MAWFQFNFQTSSLRRPVTVNALIPADGMIFGPPAGAQQSEPKPYKTLYLLHGYMGNHTDWLINTQIEEMSQQFNLAVIMPAGENAFYVDHEYSGKMYSTFIGKELVEFTRKVFPLSHEKDDTIIGGLSMGGYGALYNGLRWNGTFGHVIALSSALVVDGAAAATDAPNPMGTTRGYFESVFGDLDKVMESDKNLEVLAKSTFDAKQLTDLYIACGYNDGLVYGNRKLSSYLNEIGYTHVYEEGKGSHEWAFWNDFLKRGLDRLNLVPKREPFAGGMFMTDARADSPNPVT